MVGGVNVGTDMVGVRDDYRFFKTVKNGSNFKEFNRNEFQDFRFLTVFRLVKDFFF